MSAPFNSTKQAYVQPHLGSSGARGSIRPIASATAGTIGAAHNPSDLDRRDSLRTRRLRPPKRTNITPVACQPCKQRKHKCDGARPVCTPCLAKKRLDCAYDAAGDQRRTSALKQRIRDLETQVDDLEDIIIGIGSTGDETVAVALAHQLAVVRFRATADVAHALRTNDDVHAALVVAATSNRTLIPVRRGGNRTICNTSEASPSPSSAATADSIKFDGSNETRPWTIDAAQAYPAQFEGKFDNMPIWASSSPWPPEMASGSMLVDGAYPTQSGSTAYVETGTSASEMDGNNSYIQAGSGMPSPFWW